MGYFDTTSSRRLIIFNGLDECDTPVVQCKILDVISLLFQKYHLPILILIASRPEDQDSKGVVLGKGMGVKLRWRRSQRCRIFSGSALLKFVC